MTGDEMERAIEFLLESHANLEARQQRTDEQISQLARQVAETGVQLQAYAQTQSEFIDIVTRTMTGLAEKHAQLAESSASNMERIEASMSQLAESQQHTDERLNALIDIVKEGRNGRS